MTATDSAAADPGTQGSQRRGFGIDVGGSGVKGALRHRVAFHYASLTSVFADKMDEDDLSAWTDHCGAADNNTCS